MKMKIKVLFKLNVIFIVAVICFSAALPCVAAPEKSIVLLKKAVDSGTVYYKLTDAGEILDLLGEPDVKDITLEGSEEILNMTYGNITCLFCRKKKETSSPFNLIKVSVDGEALDIGRYRKLVLRSQKDFKKLSRFRGFQDISLQKLDLRNHPTLIDTMTFDTLTIWPPAERLPDGFDPKRLLEAGKNPGLGIRDLHKQGIIGQGVGIAIIDQPLLLGHREYTSRILRYDASGLEGHKPEMHGSPIASIAVGQNIGVAPGASLTYFAIPMWEKTNDHYIRVLKNIYVLNQTLSENEKIKVVSISNGAFRHYRYFEKWQAVLAEADTRGICVITCDTKNSINFGTLSLMEGKAPNVPESYRPDAYSRKGDVLRGPSGYKTVASHRGNAVYTYDRDGGRSWVAPYLAGLAALAFQVNPGITPGQIRSLLVETASQTDAGAVVNPKAFIDAVKKVKQ